MRGRLLLFALTALGCSIDFNRYLNAPFDGAVQPAMDRPVVPGSDVAPGTDLGTPLNDTGVGSPDRPVGLDIPLPPPECPRPYIAVTVENLMNNGSVGQILRVPLNRAQSCEPLRAGHAQPLAALQVDNTDLVVASNDGVDVYDPASGRSLGSMDHDYYSGILGMSRWSPMGMDVAGFTVAYRSTGSVSPRVSVFYTNRGAMRLNAQSVLQNTSYVGSHPTDATRYLGVREVSGMTVLDSVSVSNPMATRWLDGVTGLTTVHTIRDANGMYRAAATTWSETSRQSYVILPNTHAAPPVSIAYRRTITCALTGCTNYLRAVAVSDEHAVVLCDDGRGGPLFVVHTEPRDGACVMVQGSTLGAQTRMSNLTLVTR